ncbi:protein takeout-like [Periplaneta americana]|uniref:protein takeout-like n=1 Tax=Periplaneta americana TaxID=6978 RepID=UPI0037E8613C
MQLNRASTVIALATVLLFQDSASLKASDIFKICKRTDPQLNDCIKETLEDLRPKLSAGIAQLQIPSVKPMIIPKISVIQGSGPVSIDSSFTNTHVDGITNFVIKKVNADVDNYRIDIEVDIPFLYVYGDYQINGKVLVLPIQGSGDSWSNYTEVTGTIKLTGSKDVRDGKEYMKLDDLKFGMEVKHAIVHMNNLFNGNKELGDAMNDFMSKNWEVVFQELKPVVDEAISVILKDIARKVFEKFPMADLFPSN